MLKKILGDIVKYGTMIVAGFPIFGAAVPSKDQSAAQTVISDLQQIVGAATTVEATATALGQADNADGKIAAIAQGVAQIVLGSPLLTDKKIQDAAQFQAACNYFAQGAQALLASLHPDGAQSVNKAA